MAQVLPRIHYLNDGSSGGVTLTASSQQTPVYGITNLRDPTPTRVWRSKLGWNIVAGFNNKIYWAESGNNRVGTIATGNYASGPACAAAVTTAMNTAPGHVNTYLVSYASTQFTLARATGAASIQYDFTQTRQDSIHQDLGFSNSTPSGNSVSGNNSAYKTREWILFAGSFFGKAAFLVNTNVVTNLAYWQQASFTPVFENIAPLAADQLVGDFRIQTVSPANNAFGYGRVLITDQWINTAGYSEVGVFSFGGLLTPSRGIVPGWRQRSLQLGGYAMSDTGTVFRDVKAQPRAWDVEWRRLRESDRDVLVAFQNAVGVGGSFFFQFDPLNDPLDSYYVYLTNALEFTQRVGDGVPPDRYDVGGFSMTEHL